MTDRFYDELRAILANRGVALGNDGVLSLIPGHPGATEVSQAQLDTFNEAHRYRRVRPQQLRNWVADFVIAVDRIVAGDSTDAHALRAVFWLRLYGVLVGIREGHALEFDVLRTHVPHPNSLLGHFAPLAAAVNELRDVLSENEQLWVEYRRHVEAHIWQGAYEPQWNKKRACPKEPFTSKVTGRTYEVGDLDARLGAVLKEYASEHDIAAAFCVRLQTPAQRLFFETERYCVGA